MDSWEVLSRFYRVCPSIVSDETVQVRRLYELSVEEKCVQVWYIRELLKSYMSKFEEGQFEYSWKKYN